MEQQDSSRGEVFRQRDGEEATFSRRSFIGKGLAVAGAAGLVATLAACGSSSSDSTGTTAASSASADTGGTAAAAVPPADTSEIPGDLNWLGFQGYDDPSAIGPWLEENQVNIHPTYGSSNDDWIPKLRAGGVGTYDNLTIYMAYVPTLVELDLIQPIPLDSVPNFNDMYPPFQEAAKAVTAPDGSVYFVPLVWGRAELVYNSKFIPEGLTSYHDVLKPEYKGRLVLLDDTLTNVGTWASVLGFDSANMSMDQLNEIKDLMLQAKNNAKTIAPDFGEQTDLFAREEVWMTIGGWAALIQWVGDKGVDTLKLATTTENTWSWTDTYALVKDAPNRDAGIGLINEVISPEAQVAFASAVVSGVTNKLAEPDIPANLQSLYPYDDITAAFETAPLLALPSLLEKTGTPEKVVFQDWVNAWNEVKAS